MLNMPDFKQLQRVAFRAETTGRVKDLAGFTKGHAVPDYSPVAARKFIAKLAAGDLQVDLDQKYQALRDSFNLKRKQIEASRDDEGGVIRTPQFTYSITTDVDPEISSNFLWRREITALQDPLIVRGPEFQKVFGTLFHSLVFEFAQPLAVADLIDQLEEDERPGMKIVCGSDGSWCEITLQGFRGSIRVDSRKLVISGQQSPTMGSLLDQFLAFLEHLPRQPDMPALG